MSAPQPFRSVRPTGPSSTGGSVHTLAAHMASGNAHPQYVKKGDEVGNSNLTAHVLDPNAHVIHYLKRSELASVIGDFVASCNTQVDYSKLAENGDYKHVVSSFLLKTILSNADAVKSYFTAVSRTADVVTNFSTAISNPRPSDDYRVPHWNVFGFLRDVVGSMLIGSENSLDEGNPFYSEYKGDPLTNPLSNIFSLISHTHSQYSNKSHRHDFSDIVDISDPTSGVIAARSDHNHDGIYPRFDQLSELGITFDPNVLREVGIWERAVADPSISDEEDYTQYNLNLYDVQGNYTFKFSKVTINRSDFSDHECNFPSEFLTIVGNGYLQSDESNEYAESLSGSFEASAILSVISTNNALIDFATDNLSDYFINMSKSKTYKVVSQVMYTDAPMSRFDDNGVILDEDDDNYDPKQDYSVVNDYKDYVRSTYTRTGYSFESAWYISSVLDIILGITPKRLVESIDNPISNISAKLNSAYSDGNSRSGLVVGYCRAPYAVDDPELSTVVDKVRLAPTLTDLESSILNIIDVELTEEDASKYKNKYSGIKDICWWLIPGKKDHEGSESGEYIECESLMTPNNKVYIPYLEYYERKTAYTEIENESLDSVIDLTEVYYDYENENIVENINDEIAGLSESSETQGTYNAGDADFSGDPSDKIIGIIKEGSADPDTGFVLSVMTPVSSSTIPDESTNYFRISSSKYSDKFYTFERFIPDSGVAVGEDVYICSPVKSNDSYLWSKHVVLVGDSINTTNRYFVFDSNSLTFVDVSSVLINQYNLDTLPGSSVDILYTVTVGDDTYEYNLKECPVFTDRVIKTSYDETSVIRPEEKQYTISPFESAEAVSGESYVHVFSSTANEVKTLHDSNLSDAKTTGFASGSQVTYVIDESDNDHEFRVGEMIIQESDLTYKLSNGYAQGVDCYKNVYPVDPEIVLDDEEYNDEYVYFEATIVDGKETYSKISPQPTSGDDIEGLYRIPKDTDSEEYVLTGSELVSDIENGSMYGYKLPRYFETVRSKIRSGSEVLVKSFFFNTKDVTRLDGKTYFLGSGDIYSKIEFSDGEDLDTYLEQYGEKSVYERIDMETMFDIYCAILQLTSTGSERIDTGEYGESLANIVYNLGNDGHLVAWDNWQKYVTDANPSFVEYVVRQDEIIELVDDVLPALKDGLAHAGYDTDGSYNYANGILRLFKIVSWLNDANAGAEDSVISTRFNLLFGISAEVTTESFTERNSDGPTSEATEVSTKTNINVTRLKYGDSALSNLDDLKRKAGVAWVQNIEDRLVTQEDLNLAAIRTWLFGDTTSAIPSVSTSINSRLTDLETFSAWARTAITNATGSGGGGLIINSTVTDYDIGPFLANASAQDVVNLNGTVQYNGSDYSILGISENGYTPYQFSIVLKTDVGAGAEYEVIENPVAEVLVHRANTGTVKGAIYVPASSLLWIIVTGANHGVYFRVPDSWVDLYDIRTNSGVADGVSPNIKVCLRVRYFGNSSSGIGRILSGV